MIFVENIWEEYVNLDHVVKMWIEDKDTHYKVYVRYTSGSMDEVATFKEEKTAKKYLMNILSAYGEIKLVEDKDIRERP